MRRIYLIPAIFVTLAGFDLPLQGPVPVDKPLQSTVPAEKAPTSAQEATPDVSSADKKPPSLPGVIAPEETDAALAICETELNTLGVTFEKLDPVIGENGCGINAPYAITEIAKGVALRPATQLRCKTAVALARWIGAVVLPATSAFPDEVHLKAINHGSTYVCRRRNNLPTGKMSEHSIGNAVDVVNFEFEGRKPIGISPRSGDGNMDEAFQRAVRAGACLHFTTVLGPGANASHDDHLHLDIAKRNRGYRLCQ
ncbi:hypothetical protein IMCC20628_00616 [Hoeflea sp. IMCC20628]|uniref:extensin-like domain-containing protein n=1 Tax=Hoeflea sp. IMCC20628 TaxID=1620421 RepID=UPI00063AB1CF|nr:extensin family protein [Hoeflea sp. IMCC20628]AKH99340.1 hypothetical protein IMCC20628_00616 [Hoeflea sp. IMCC20628]